jgi:hypothetical protein
MRYAAKRSERMAPHRVTHRHKILQVAWLWYGFAIIYWVPLFAMTIFRVTTREAMGEHSFIAPLPVRQRERRHCSVQLLFSDSHAHQTTG